MTNKNKKIIIWILKVFILWRLGLFILALIGTKILAFKYSFPYSNTDLSPLASQFIWQWANFDGVHYIRIAESGYSSQYTQAFFPLYPLLIQYIASVFKNVLITGLILSNISFIFALYFFYKLINLDYSQKIAKSSVLFLILFPTSFFFGSLYTESLFLFLILLAFYFMRISKWISAGIVGFFASVTRIFGVFLIPSYLCEYYLAKKTKKNKIKFSKILLASIITLSGLGLYMRYLAVNFSDPFYFAHSLPAFGSSRSVDKVILLYQVFYRYIKMILTPGINNFFYYTIILEFLSALLFLMLIILGYVKKIRPSYLLFAVFAYIIPTLTGTFSSMPRYVLVLFPCFMVLGMIENKWLKGLIYLIFTVLLAVSTIMFTRGYWIA